MMKRLSLKGLRISSSGVGRVMEQSDDSEYEEPLPPRRSDSECTESADTTGDIGEGTHRPGSLENPRALVRRKREKKSFFRSLRRKIMTNVKSKKQERCGSVIDDDSSSETKYEPEHVSAARATSPHRPKVRQSGIRGAKHVQSQHQTQLEAGAMLQLTKKELSKSISADDSSSTPTDEDKAQMVADDEYGHTTAISSNSLNVPGCGSASPSPRQSPRLRHSTCCNISSHYASSADAFGATTYAAQCLTNESSGVGSAATAGNEECSNVTCSESSELTRRQLRVPDIPLPDLPNLHKVVNSDKEEPTYSWSLTRELFRLSKHGWYWGPITRVESEEKLLDQVDGAFLVRDSSDERYLLSLSFRSYGRTLHTRIEHCNGVFSFYAQPETEGYTSIVELIEHSMSDSKAGVFCYSRARAPGSPSFPVRLTKPISRFSQVRSLQYLCRFEIRQYIRYDHIQRLPLPSSIKTWLQENQYG